MATIYFPGKIDQLRVNGGSNYELPGECWVHKLILNTCIFVECSSSSADADTKYPRLPHTADLIQQSLQRVQSSD